MADEVYVEMELMAPPGEGARVHDGRRSHRRGRVLLVLAIVALVAIGAVVATARPLDSSSTVHPAAPHRTTPSPLSAPAPVTPTAALEALPQGPPPAVPYLRHGVLHVDDLTVRTEANRLLVAGDTVLVGRSGEDDAHWQMLDGVDLVPVPELDGIFTPSLSLDGGLVAWTSYPDKRTTRVTAWQPSTRTEVAHVDLPAPYAECCGGGQEVEIYGFDLRNQVYFTDRHGYSVWRPSSGTRPRRLSGVDAILEVAPVGPVRQGGALGRVDADGHWSKVADLPTDQGMLWSADGRLVTYAGDGTGAVPSSSHPPRRGCSTTPPRVDYLLRCAVGGGPCERALPPRMPTGSFVFPERSYF